MFMITIKRELFSILHLYSKLIHLQITRIFNSCTRTHRYCVVAKCCALNVHPTLDVRTPFRLPGLCSSNQPSPKPQTDFSAGSVPARVRRAGFEPLGKRLSRKMTQEKIERPRRKLRFLERKRGLQRGGFTRFVWHSPGSASDPNRPVCLRLLADLGLLLLIINCTHHGYRFIPSDGQHGSFNLPVLNRQARRHPQLLIV